MGRGGKRRSNKKIHDSLEFQEAPAWHNYWELRWVYKDSRGKIYNTQEPLLVPYDSFIMLKDFHEGYNIVKYNPYTHTMYPVHILLLPPLPPPPPPVIYTSSMPHTSECVVPSNRLLTDKENFKWNTTPYTLHQWNTYLIVIMELNNYLHQIIQFSPFIPIFADIFVRNKNFYAKEKPIKIMSKEQTKNFIDDLTIILEELSDIDYKNMVDAAKISYIYFTQELLDYQFKLLAPRRRIETKRILRLRRFSNI